MLLCEARLASCPALDYQTLTERGKIMRLFHRTSPAEAARIVKTGEWRSHEHPARVYFSTVSEGQADGYGEAVLEVDLDESVCELDDEFPDGEQHYAVPAQALAGVRPRIRAS